MKRSSLSRQLLRMGWAAGRRAGGGQVRVVALLLAAAVVALGLSAVSATYAAYDGIERRTAERGLQFHDAFPTRPTVALAQPDFDSLQGRQFSLVYVRPLSPRMELPPGVDSWPDPGEALLSPALSRALHAEGAPRRYGKVAGLIGDEGLASPGERYAYVNPTDRQLDKKRAYPIVGFGSGLPTGDVRFIADRGKFLTALYLILLPAAALAIVAVRMGSAGRDKRTALVSALGGGRRHRVLLNLGESAAPVVAGAVIGILPALWLLVAGNVRLPWINYWLSTADLRRWWPAFALSGLAAATALLLLVCLVHRPPKKNRAARSTRLAARRSRAVHQAALACPVLLFATVWGPAQLDPSQHADLRMKLYNTGVVLVMATLPCAVAVGAAALGQGLARLSRRTGDAGALISGRHSAAHPGVIARLVAGVGIALVLVSQVQLKSAQFGENARAAQATANRIGGSVLLMKVSDQLPRGRVNAVLDRLPPKVETFGVYQQRTPGSSPPALIRGSCGALRAVELACSARRTTLSSRVADQRLVETLRWVSPVMDRFSVEQGRALPAQQSADAPERLVLVASDGRDVPQEAIKQLLRDNLPIASAGVEAPGDGWLEGAREPAAHGRWVIFFGVPGVLIVALAISLANLAEFLRFSRKVAPLSVLAGSRKVYYVTAAWALLVPLLASIATSMITASWLAAPQERAAAGVELSGDVLATTAGSLAVLAVLTWWCGAHAAVRQSNRWRPHGE
ncbi:MULTISPECIES: hypothetical protein [unclassified Streptomyces]|uniref:hypothetical protein n=1 Tax=unclassified Streptomyces TaxID=2593676 RepID=UPI00382AC2BE